MGRPSRDAIGVPSALVEKCLKADQARPLRVWLVARGIEGEGTGHIRKTELLAGLMRLGVKRSTAFEWLRELKASRFASRGWNVHGDEVVVFTSIHDLMQQFEIARSNHDVKIRLASLLGRAYKRNLANACRAALPARPMSREAIQERFGVSLSTQRRGERDARAVVQKNAKRLGSSKHPRAVVPAMDHPAHFAIRDQLFQRLPNTTQFPAIPVVRRRRNCPGLLAGQATERHERRYQDGRRTRHRGWRSPETGQVEGVLVLEPFDKTDPIARRGYATWLERS